jgi:Outer membrane lipoprotein-sorting protein
MSFRSSALALLCSVLAGAASHAASKLPGGASAEDIQTCVRHNFPDQSMIQTVKMVSVDRLGVERVLEAEMFWQKDADTQRSKVLMTFDNPPELRGASVLVIEKTPQNDMFMFLPELKKTRRITSQMVQGNMMGTDFSYEDFQRLQGMLTSLESKRLPDETILERKAFVTESQPSDPTSEYTNVKSWIDQETCVPLQVELYTKQSKTEPAKRMTMDPKAFSQENGAVFPRDIAMQDLRTETSTRIVVEKLQMNVPIDRKRFSAGELERQGRFSGGSTH